MDRKTLEYMESRAKKARAIVQKIDSLLMNIESINNKKILKVKFINHRHDLEFETKELTSLVSESYIKIATQKIQGLEAELADL
jgi:hypothetical protein